MISTSYAKNSKSFPHDLLQSCLEKDSPLYDIMKTDIKGKIFTLEGDKNKDGSINMFDLEFKGYLEGDGDFRSEEVKKLRDEADIIITNPPFSLFREFVAILMKYEKKFIIWGNNNAITYKEFFPLLRDNKVWIGYLFNATCVFELPDFYEKWDEKTTNEMKKTVFVTGANKGIGFGITKYLGLSGWRVVLGARDEKRANDAIAKLKALNVDVAGWVKVELSDLDSIKNAADEVNAKYPEVNLLVNNAGIPGNMAHKSWETEIKDIKETLDVNYIGTFALTKALLPLIQKNKGRIANVTVPSEVSPYWHPLAYVASKASQNAMTGIMAMEFQQNNIAVEIFTVHPGPTTTDLNGNMSLPGFHDIDTVGEKFAELINDGKSHQGEFIELYPIVEE